MRTTCPFCHGVWQTIAEIGGRMTFVHFCTEQERYVGWGVDAVPFHIPNEYIYQNPPEG